MQHIDAPQLPVIHHEYPALFDVRKPARYDRVQLALRFVVLLVFSAISAPIGSLTGVLLLGLPVVAAVVISSKGAAAFQTETSKEIVRIVRWVLSFYSYLALLTDRFPQFSEPDTLVRFELAPSGTPTTGSALLRLFTSIPYAVVLAAIGIAAWFVWLVCVVSVLATENVPPGLYEFLRGVMRWQARLFAYHSSLVEEYPPWSLDTEPLQG